MPIEFRKGNIFSSEAAALVVPVNCEGVMGKGLALQFKQKYPRQMFDDYVAYCRRGSMLPGDVNFVWTDARCEVPGLFKPVIFFATKGYWRNSSQVAWIRSGLKRLPAVIEAWRFESVALPPVGCGLGGLGWGPLIRPMIEEELQHTRARILVYEP